VLQKYQIPATIYLIGECVETNEAPWYDRIFVAVDSARGPSLDVELEMPRHFPLSSPAARASAAWDIVCYLRSIPDVARRQWCSDFEARAKLSPERLQGRMLNWEQVREMDKGGILFGAHTMSHPVVSRLGAAELDSELADSKRLLESRLEKPVHDFAYPFGKAQDCGVFAERFLARCGYQSAVTTIEGFNTAASNPYRLRRVQIGDDASLPMFAFNIARISLESSVESDSAQLESQRYRRSVTPDMGANEG
jgi:peptidoglycan/xylan/chitin deacetylase (PgdA/CDA1 family)